MPRYVPFYSSKNSQKIKKYHGNNSSKNQEKIIKNTMVLKQNSGENGCSINGHVYNGINKATHAAHP
jgi:hypothetical protein